MEIAFDRAIELFEQTSAAAADGDLRATERGLQALEQLAIRNPETVLFRVMVGVNVAASPLAKARPDMARSLVDYAWRIFQHPPGRDRFTAGGEPELGREAAKTIASALSALGDAGDTGDVQEMLTRLQFLAETFADDREIAEQLARGPEWLAGQHFNHATQAARDGDFSRALAFLSSIEGVCLILPDHAGAHIMAARSMTNIALAAIDADAPHHADDMAARLSRLQMNTPIAGDDIGQNLARELVVQAGWTQFALGSLALSSGDAVRLGRALAAMVDLTRHNPDGLAAPLGTIQGRTLGDGLVALGSDWVALRLPGLDGTAAGHQWLMTPRPELAGQMPIDMLANGGLADVLALVEHLSGGAGDIAQTGG